MGPAPAAGRLRGTLEAFTVPRPDRAARWTRGSGPSRGSVEADLPMVTVESQAAARLNWFSRFTTWERHEWLAGTTCDVRTAVAFDVVQHFPDRAATRHVWSGTTSRCKQYRGRWDTLKRGKPRQRRSEDGFEGQHRRRAGSPDGDAKRRRSRTDPSPNQTARPGLDFEQGIATVRGRTPRRCDRGGQDR